MKASQAVTTTGVLAEGRGKKKNPKVLKVRMPVSQDMKMSTVLQQYERREAST